MMIQGFFLWRISRKIAILNNFSTFFGNCASDFFYKSLRRLLKSNHNNIFSSQSSTFFSHPENENNKKPALSLSDIRYVPMHRGHTRSQKPKFSSYLLGLPSGPARFGGTRVRHRHHLSATLGLLLEVDEFPRIRNRIRSWLVGWSIGRTAYYS